MTGYIWSYWEKFHSNQASNFVRRLRNFSFFQLKDNELFADLFLCHSLSFFLRTDFFHVLLVSRFKLNWISFHFLCCSFHDSNYAERKLCLSWMKENKSEIPTEELKQQTTKLYLKPMIRCFSHWCEKLDDVSFSRSDHWTIQSRKFLQWGKLMYICASCQPTQLR